MARRIRAKPMMGLREQGLSRRKIAKTRHMSMESACDVSDMAAERGITWEQVEGMTDDEVYRPSCPDRHVHESVFEPTLDMRERSWLRCHVHMCEFWGGVPERTVCGNLKTGVVKHPREGEIVLNDAYEALGERYMAAIVPAQAREPKQKASAEGTVRDVATWVIAQPRSRTFASFDEAVLAVREKLAEYNAHPSQKREGSRGSVFAEAEAAELRPLPDVRYDVAGWACNRSANLGFRVVYARNRCPAPHRYVGRKVDLRVGESTLPIYHAGERIATHRLLPPLRQERPLHGGGPHARGVRQARMGRRAHQALGGRRGPRVRRGRGAHVRARQAQGAGVQPGAVGAEALGEVRQRSSRGRMRARVAEGARGRGWNRSPPSRRRLLQGLDRRDRHG